MGINVGKKIVAWVDKPKSRGTKIALTVVAILAITVPVTSAYVAKKIAENYAETTAAADAEVLGSANTAPTSSPPVVAKPSPAKIKKPVTKKTTDTDTKSASTEIAPTVVAPKSPYPDTYPADLKSAYKNTVSDEWGYDNRGSASYAAWKVKEILKSTRMSDWKTDPRSKNVTNWPVLADESSVLRGSAPRLHSVAVVNNFAAWVEAVNGDKVTVSFYNWGDSGAHGIWKDVPATNFSTYIYF